MWYLFIVKVDKNLMYYVIEDKNKELAEQKVKIEIGDYSPNRANISFCFECKSKPEFI